MRIDSVGTMTVTSTDQSIATFSHSSSSTAALNGGGIVNIKNTDSTNGNQMSIIFRDSADISTSGIFGFNTDHSDGEGFMKFGTRDSGGTFAERIRVDHHGIKFNADTAEANGLNDYEEGTFDAPVKGSGSDPTTAINAQGFYIKVGNIVNLHLRVAAGNFAGASGYIFFNNMPFTANSSFAPVGSIMHYNTLTHNPDIVARLSGTQMYIYSSASGAAWATANHNASTNAYIDLSITYMAN